MADSIQEQIVKKMVLALQSVTTANGYANSLLSVQRRNQLGINLNALPTVQIIEGDCTTDLLKSAYPHVRRRMDIDLMVAVQQDETSDSADTRSGAEMLNSLIADIEWRFGASQNWDGLAIMTDPPSYPMTMIDATTPHLSHGMTFSVTYEHLRGNPYAQ